MHVKEIMKKVKTLREDVSLRDAAKFMADNAISCVVIMDGDEMKGIVTERDVLKQVSKDVKVLDKPVKEVMSTEIITISSDSYIDDAAELMTKHKIKKLPVLEDGKLVGIITTTDLVSNAEDFNEFSVFS